METEVDAQGVLSCCFAASSSRAQSAMLSSGGDCKILASADLALHIALTFSCGKPPNAGSMNSGNNTANNTKARFIQPPSCNETRVREPIGGYRGSSTLEKRAPHRRLAGEPRLDIGQHVIRPPVVADRRPMAALVVPSHRSGDRERRWRAFLRRLREPHSSLLVSDIDLHQYRMFQIRPE